LGQREEREEGKRIFDVSWLWKGNMAQASDGSVDVVDVFDCVF